MCGTMTGMRVMICVALLFLSGARAQCCTGFCASGRGLVLAGNNEDYNKPFTKMWFVPAEQGTYGRVYVGFDNFWPQGGMNERGVFFDGFATERLPAASSAGKEVFRGNLLDRAMAECATVEQVIALFEKYNRSFLENAVLFFADANGDSVIVEPNAILRKQGRYQVQTNFHQSRVKPGEIPCERYKIAASMLDEAGENISVALFRRILAATHAEGTNPTLYSNIYDLKRRVMYLYHFHNFENVVTIDLAAELKKGKRALDLPTLFPRTFAAELFARNRQRERERPIAKVDPRLYDAYAGGYELPTGITLEISRDGDRLFVDASGYASGYAKLELFPESETKFFLKTMSAQVTFVRGERGRVDRLIIRQDGQETVAERFQ
ncbi:MAG TPA: DUF3471 domain-containing protein [Bryobacteraceae bacterium]|nr:DUF3471 domain-containing protein [Bryobacteraceae bacterium]